MPVTSNRNVKIVVDGFKTVGDAASVFDSVTGETSPGANDRKHVVRVAFGRSKLLLEDPGEDR